MVNWSTGITPNPNGDSLIRGDSRRSTSATADSIQFRVHARPVVARDVAEQFVASWRQIDGGPGGSPGKDAVTGVSAAAARSLSPAAGLIDFVISADGPLAWILAGIEGQHHHFVGQRAAVVDP